MRRDRGADIGLIAVAAIWGLTFPAIRSAMTGGASPFAFVGARFLLATVLMAPLAVAGLRRAGAPILRPAVFLGVLLGASYLFQTIGMVTTTAANSGFITGTSVVMVPFLDAVVRRTRLAPTAIAGAALAVGGLYVLSGPSVGGTMSVGDLWTLGSAFGYALYLVMLQDHLDRFEHWPLLTAQLAVVAFAALTLGPIVEPMQLDPRPEVLAAIGFCALFATVGTGLLQFRFQGRTSPSRAALIFAMEPVFAAVFAALLLGEALPQTALAGGALIVVGVIVAELGSVTAASDAASSVDADAQ